MGKILKKKSADDICQQAQTAAKRFREELRELCSE